MDIKSIYIAYRPSYALLQMLYVQTTYTAVILQNLKSRKLNISDNLTSKPKILFKSITNCTKTNMYLLENLFSYNKQSLITNISITTLTDTDTRDKVETPVFFQSNLWHFCKVANVS